VIRRTNNDSQGNPRKERRTPALGRGSVSLLLIRENLELGHILGIDGIPRQINPAVPDTFGNRSRRTSPERGVVVDSRFCLPFVHGHVRDPHAGIFRNRIAEISAPRHKIPPVWVLTSTPSFAMNCPPGRRPRSHRFLTLRRPSHTGRTPKVFASSSRSAPPKRKVTQRKCHLTAAQGPWVERRASCAHS
jgi:hypothetical protein